MGSPQRPVLFDPACAAALAFAQRHVHALGAGAIVVRDAFGRLRIAIDDRTGAVPPDLMALAAELHGLLGAYGPGPLPADAFLLASELFSPEHIFESAELQTLSSGVRLLERQVSGEDWLRPPLTIDTTTPRATLFGIKGGVGRSTALAMWARYLAMDRGKRVLVVDLDFESPGVSSLLLPPASLPNLGLVDYLVEAAVGQGDAVLSQIVAKSPLVVGHRGDIRVVPCCGSEPGDYVAKLSRVYQAAPQSGDGLAARLQHALVQLESLTQPDVVLLDSRAGLHDIAAIALTRLGALGLLFAGGTPQTLQAYRLLFDGLRRHPQHLRALRQNLQMVAALVPDKDRAGYLKRLRERFYDLFADCLYDDESALPGPDDGSAGEEGWNYSLQEDEAPHDPIPIRFYGWFQDFDPNAEGAFDPQEIDAAFGTFHRRATDLLLARHG